MKVTSNKLDLPIVEFDYFGVKIPLNTKLVTDDQIIAIATDNTKQYGELLVAETHAYILPNKESITPSNDEDEIWLISKGDYSDVTPFVNVVFETEDEWLNAIQYYDNKGNKI